MTYQGGPYFKFNPAISLMVTCESADEVDAKWEALSEGGRELMPLGDGVSWQVVPDNMDELLSNGSKEEIQKVEQELLKMKKIDIAALEKARTS